MGASGFIEIDFGAFPGGYETSVAVTGQTGIGATSLVEAWLHMVATADHSADEHLVEDQYLRIIADASSIIAGTGFTIRAIYACPLIEVPLPQAIELQTAAAGRDRLTGYRTETERQAPRAYGRFNVAWVWNTP